MKVRCDDYGTIFVDGELRGTTNHWAETTTLQILEETAVVGVKCRDTGGENFIWVQATDHHGNVVMVTDTSWKCSTQLQDSWSTGGFVEDNTWQRATIRDTAGKIWTNSFHDKTVYCRAYLPSTRRGICWRYFVNTHLLNIHFVNIHFLSILL